MTRLLAWCAIVPLLAGCGGVTPIRTAFNKGVFQSSQGNHAGAVREFRIAVADDPSDTRARFNLGAALEEAAAEPGISRELAAARREEARKIYAALLADEPNHPRASANLAAMEFEDAGDDLSLAAPAEERLKACARAHSSLVLPRTALAAHYLRTERYEAAAPWIAEALALDGSDVEANFMQGVRLAATGEPDLARKSFLTALKNEPDDVATLLALGELERKAGRPAEAKTAYRRAAMVRSDVFAAHFALAELAAEAGEDETALLHLIEARRLDDLGRRCDELHGPRPNYRARMIALYERLLARARDGA